MIKIVVYTSLALTAFAFNSILCRLALRSDEIDAAGFTAVRLISGAVTLIVISYFFDRNAGLKRGNWGSAFFLFAYAVCFSFAYVSLSAGTGALLLFGCVQATMIIAAFARGERPRPLEWIGLCIAVAGLVYLVLPGLSAPRPAAAGLMAASGIAWGVYTLKGKGSTDPLADTTGNFIRSVPMIAVVLIPFWQSVHLSNRGVVLAILSGSAASGVGYTIWYAVLKHHTATRAAILQLAVPVIAADAA